MSKSEITKYLSTIGAKGGAAGTGKAKRRSKEHYRLAGLKSAAKRAQKAMKSGLSKQS